MADSVKSTAAADASADKLRHSAENEATTTHGAKDQTAAVEAYHELSGSEHSKGRPAPDAGTPASERSKLNGPSNAGNDGN